MAIWYTSDHHFGHANIIGYCDRPFASVWEMDEAMVERWNERVGADDDVWVLGDFAMGKTKESLRRSGPRLAGRKILVPGNHDRCWKGRSKGRSERGSYYRDGGFDEIVDNPDPHMIGGQQVRLDHFPYRLDSQYDQRYMDYRPEDDGGWLLHGHIHENWRQNGRQINVGVDVWDYAPAHADEIAALIAAGENTLDRHGNPAEAGEHQPHG